MVLRVTASRGGWNRSKNIGKHKTRRRIIISSIFFPKMQTMQRRRRDAGSAQVAVFQGSLGLHFNGEQHTDFRLLRLREAAVKKSFKLKPGGDFTNQK